MLAWELVGAVVGAGLASGREIASFFSQYGEWSWLGIILSVSMLFWLTNVQIPQGWHGRWPGMVWQTLLTLLLVVTGGAMLSGAGEVTAQTIPLRGAYWLGTAAAFFLAWLLVSRTAGGLAWVSRIMLCAMAVLIGLGFTLPPMRSAPVQEPDALEAILRSLTYGGFNASLLIPILGVNSDSLSHKKRAVRKSCLIVFLLLSVGNAVLLRHPVLLGEPMPYLRMMNQYGEMGFWLGASSLYLAILSTLTACLRGLNGRMVPIIGILLVSLLGFSGVVERCYPFIGGVCFAMLGVVKFLNCFSKSFQS